MMRISLPALPRGLPPLDTESSTHLQATQAVLAERVRAAQDGFLPFDEWMDIALYQPGIGYYAAGNAKFASDDQPVADFTTAPELTPVFGRVVARQVHQILGACHSISVLEFGAGSGALAESLIGALRDLGVEPAYQILEVSGELRQRQQQRLRHLDADIQWLDRLPLQFEGCVVANEVLDAMPVKLFRWSDSGELLELGVTWVDDEDGMGFQLTGRAAPDSLVQIVRTRVPFMPGYQSEINLRAEAWVGEMGQWLKKGAALLVDYGFPRHEYYHPQRAEGTLMCHFRHHAHGEPLVLPGLQDITAHVDFTAMADAAVAADLDVLGYTSQGRFLMNAGLAQAINNLDPGDTIAYARAVAAVQRLMSEAEMGELFKVLAVGRNIDVELVGFSHGDRRHRL